MNHCIGGSNPRRSGLEGIRLECYFDNSATTRPSKEAAAAMTHVINDVYGNPSSLHVPGSKAAAELERSRAALAGAFRSRTDEIYFTAGGTESNNLSIFGTVMALKRRGNRIVTTCVEHPSVEEPMKRLEEEGFDVVRLPVDRYGYVSEADVMDAVTKDTILVSMMAVNNEVGSIQPIAAAKKAVQKAGSPAYVHVDAVQAFGKIPIIPKNIGADLVSASGHKIHGPKGTGVLYKRKGLRLVPYILGGGQEDNVRSGTQNLPGIAGFAAAVDGIGDLGANRTAVTAVRNALLEGIRNVPGLVVNSSPDALPYILNLSVMGIPSEVLRNYLSERGVYVSTGSACSKGHRSSVLTAMGLSPEQTDAAVRFSFSRFNTVDEAEYAVSQIRLAAEELRRV